MRRTWDDQDYRDRRAATEAQPTTKARRSAAAHEVNNRPGRREQQSEIMREKFAHDDDFRRRHTAGLKAAMQADEYYGEKRAEAMKQAWRELRGDLRNSFKLLEERPLTAYESAVALVLLRDNIAFVPHDTSSGYEMDLYVPSKNLDIEVDGKHHLRDKFIAKDTERDQVLTNRGYAILRISHDEIDDKSFISMIIDALTP